MRAASFAAVLAFVVVACQGELRLDADAGISCDTKGQCPFGLVCASTACVECNADANCKGSLTRCDLASHRCVQCGATADCPPSSVCEPQTKRCVRGCTMASMCMSDGYRDCDMLRGYCVACATNAQCSGDDKVCDTRIGQCVECVVDGDCIDPEKKRCDPVTSHCVRCLDNGDCKSDSPICNVHDHECSHMD
jgi:hypothetical protein